MSQWPVGDRDTGPRVSRWDEMRSPSEDVRPSWQHLESVVSTLGESGLADRRATIARLLQDDGVGYRVPGSTLEQPWSLDPLPLLIEQQDWRKLETGLIQRAVLLDAVLTDLYSERSLIAGGLLPAALVYAHDGFLRAADGVRLPGPRQLVLASADLGRGADGRWVVLADRVQAPSGAGYAMENRSVVSRALPRLYRRTEVHRIAGFLTAVRASLQQLAPRSDEPARVVLLTPGTMSETAFDQGHLAALLGFPLVEGNDLIVRHGRVWQRSLGRLEPVDVILRRVDAGFCDPLELRPDSRLGVAGLLEAARSGSVSIVNPLGAGVLENPALFTHLPALCQALLGEPLLLDSAPSWWCGDPQGRQHVLTHLRELIIKPTSRATGMRSIHGWQLGSEARDELAARITAQPHLWVGQVPVVMSTAPTVRGLGTEARTVTLRSFAVSDGDTYRVMPGGLSRAASRPDSLVVSNADGAVSKDVWVLSASPEAESEASAPTPDSIETLTAAVSPRVAEDLYWLGRYLERAEGVARLLRVCDNRWRDLHPQPDPALARCLVTLLEALTTVSGTWPGFSGAGAPTLLAAPQDELLALIADGDRVGSLAFDLGRIRRLAHAVRDQLSNDTWMVLATLDRVLTPFVADPGAADPTSDAGRRIRPADEIPAALARLLEALLALSGLLAESMVRDTGWRLLDAGRRLERAVQTATLLQACLTGEPEALTEGLVMESVLTAAESIITHRRRYPAHAGVDTVVALLLTDTGNPRSVAFQLDRLTEDLTELPDGAHSAALARTALADLTAMLRPEDLPALFPRELSGEPPDALALEFAQEFPENDAWPKGLDGRLSGLIHQLLALSAAIERAHFIHPQALQPLEEFSVDVAEDQPAGIRP